MPPVPLAEHGILSALTEESRRLATTDTPNSRIVDHTSNHRGIIGGVSTLATALCSIRELQRSATQLTQMHAERSGFSVNDGG